MAEIRGQTLEATWCENGYYFTENGVHCWKKVADWIAQEAFQPDFLNGNTTLVDQADGIELFKAVGPATCNVRTICISNRARKLFGWKPVEIEMKDMITGIIRSEADGAGTIKK